MSHVFFISQVGALRVYKNLEMFNKTFSMFLNALEHQTCKDFSLILVGHDLPCQLPNWVRWHTLLVPEDTERQYSLVYQKVDKLEEVINLPKQIVPYNTAREDKGNKVFTALVEVFKTAHKQNMKSFWIVRIDSDDFVANVLVEKIQHKERVGVQAIYTTQAHIIDVKTNEFGEYVSPYSLPCNMLFHNMHDLNNITPNWLYHYKHHYNDHTKFAPAIKVDRIAHKHISYCFCYSTNSGNHISGRTTIDSEKRAKHLSLTPELRKRYSISQLLQPEGGCL